MSAASGTRKDLPGGAQISPFPLLLVLTSLGAVNRYGAPIGSISVEQGRYLLALAFQDSLGDAIQDRFRAACCERSAA